MRGQLFQLLCSCGEAVHHDRSMQYNYKTEIRKLKERARAPEPPSRICAAAPSPPPSDSRTFHLVLQFLNGTAHVLTPLILWGYIQDPNDKIWSWAIPVFHIWVCSLLLLEITKQ